MMADRVGKEEFRRMILSFRNRHIVVAMAPLVSMREEAIGTDDVGSRAGVDGTTKDHLLEHLYRCDLLRRWITHNPDGADLGLKIKEAIDPAGKIKEVASPFGGDDVQQPSTGLVDVPWDFDGSNPKIPLRKTADSSVRWQYEMKGEAGLLLVGGMNQALEQWTRLSSKDRSAFITQKDSMRMYGLYQQIHGYLLAFCGDANMVDFAQLPASEEPLGPQDSANRVGETTGNVPAATK